MFNWVCPRCGHEVPPSKTECPFCAPPSAEQGQPQPPAQQYPPPPPQYQQVPPQYWQPQPPPQQYAPPAPPYAQQQAPPQYWQPPQQYQPQQYPPQPQPPYQPPTEPPQPQFQPPPPPPQQYAPPVQYAPAPPAPPEYRPKEYAPTPWPTPEQQAGKPMWLVGLLAFLGVIVVFGIAYFVMGSHGSSSAKDAAVKEQTANPMQKYIEVVGVRIVTDKGNPTVKFLVVNHSGVELTDLVANVTLWASTQRSEEDSVGTFMFHIDSVGPNDSKDLTAPLKTDRHPSDMPEDWRNMTADVQVTSTPQ